MILPDYAPVIAAATLFTQSYNQSALVYHKGATSAVAAKTLGSYYGDTNFIGFYNGMSQGNNSQASITSITQTSIDFFEKQGNGYNIHIRKFKVEPYAEDGAAIFVDWNMKPKQSGLKDLEWTTVYGYRMKNSMNPTLYQDMKSKCGPEGSLACKVAGKEKTQGWFEFTITDNEIKTMMERFPNYMESYSP